MINYNNNIKPNLNIIIYLYKQKKIILHVNYNLLINYK